MTLQERVKRLVDDIQEKLPEQFAINAIEGAGGDRAPFSGVFLQECERMNSLLCELSRWNFTRPFSCM